MPCHVDKDFLVSSAADCFKTSPFPAFPSLSAFSSRFRGSLQQTATATGNFYWRETRIKLMFEISADATELLCSYIFIGLSLRLHSRSAASVIFPRDAKEREKSKSIRDELTQKYSHSNFNLIQSALCRRSVDRKILDQTRGPICLLHPSDIY